jgi:hypothetical protein
MRKAAVAVIMSVVLASSAFAVHAVRHPNLARAHRELKTAIASISAAQRANEYQLGGHAARAKELLEQAEAELRQAVEEANENKR